jgi:aerobic carbon-monoxide dehydrogenase medium subunit
MSARIAYLGIAGAPIRGYDVEAAIAGTALDEAALDAAAEASSMLVSDDMGDVHATVEYRRVLTGELTKRVLRTAWERRAH